MESIHPLKAYREKQEPPLTQQGLADLIGVDRVTVTRWESGVRKPEAERLSVIAEKTGIAAAELRPDLAALMQPTTEAAPEPEVAA